MARTQQHPIGDTVQAGILQFNLTELYELAHDHRVVTSLPTANEGSPGDILGYDDGTNKYLLLKTKNGWFRTAALTAI